MDYRLRWNVGWVGIVRECWEFSVLYARGDYGMIAPQRC